MNEITAGTSPIPIQKGYELSNKRWAGIPRYFFRTPKRQGKIYHIKKNAKFSPASKISSGRLISLNWLVYKLRIALI